MKKNSRFNYKGNAVKFKDDDYETPKYILEMILPYITPYKRIYDPFYCNGYVINEWKELNKECINEKKDAFNRDHPENYDIIISNIPFSIKKKCFELLFKLDKPFIILTTIDTLGSVWIKKYFNDLQFIISNTKKSSSWFDTMWVCYGLNLPEKIIKIPN